jgi:hypothetical protein
MFNFHTNTSVHNVNVTFSSSIAVGIFALTAVVLELVTVPNATVMSSFDDSHIAL